MFRARTERYSVSPRGDELYTVVAEFPRVVLAEAVTHRAASDTWDGCEVVVTERATTKDMSKNSGSSRAIPFPRMLEKVNRDPYMPKWTLNQKGMQGADCNDASTIEKGDALWLRLRDAATEAAAGLHELGIHKQDCNRCLEPWAWVTQVITATGKGWNNFFNLRCHKDAHPALQRIARMIYLAKRQSEPDKLGYSQWHLPFVPREEALALRWVPSYDSLVREEVVELPDLIKFSAARCAWVSYENHDRDGSPVALLGTWGKLLGGSPKHASPVEHQGTPFMSAFPRRLESNLKGWLQARKLLTQEHMPEYSPPDDEVASWGIEGPLWPENEVTSV